MFFRGSRYEGVPEATLPTPDGRSIRYKRMRFVPDVAGTLPYRVQPDDRPDLIAYKVAGDPELFWRLCDANRVMRPDELTAEPGRMLKLPAPGG